MLSVILMRLSNSLYTQNVHIKFIQETKTIELHFFYVCFEKVTAAAATAVFFFSERIPNQ